MKTPPPAAPAAGPPTWPPSAPPSSRPSKTPATCTSPKAGATTPPQPKPSASTASIRTDADIHGTRRSPVLDLLKEIIIVPSGALDVVVALDWYKIPAEGVDPYRWPNTE